jgi:serine/threonine protein phosphatase 1
MRRTYAIGDIHGSLAKLRKLVTLCHEDAAGSPMSFVFIGDYVDRGPDTREVIEYVMTLQARMPGEVTTLMGNHELLVLEAIDGGPNVDNWLRQGGAQTLHSYGVERAAALPMEHVHWLCSLRVRHDDGRRLFVHAGIDPEKSLDAQEDMDLLWIREPFLSDRRYYGRLIVHGHTPTEDGKPELFANRVNVDTGAVFGGPLTAAVFTDEETAPLGFIQADE